MASRYANRNQERVKLEGFDELIQSFEALGDLLPRTRAPLRKSMRASVTLVAREARRKLAEGLRTGRFYWLRNAAGEPRLHRASAPGEAPAPIEKNLAKSIRQSVSRKGWSGKVKTGDPKAHIMEYGSEKQEPRPFLRPALAEKGREIIAELEKGFMGALGTIFRKKR